MKTLLLTFFLFFPFLYPLAQDVNVLIKEADRLEAIPDENAAFVKFKEVLKVKPTNLYALSKCSELCIRIGKRQADAKMRDNYYEAGKIYATTALKIDPVNSDASCAMAMALGRSTMSKSGKEKILNAREIKKYVDISLKSNPNNFKAWHVLGRWHYEISNLNFFERSAVKLFYGGLPESSLAAAIAAFEKSQSITSGFILNYFEMARAYHRNDDNAKAIAALKAMFALPSQTEDDPGIKADGRKLLNEWQ